MTEDNKVEELEKEVKMLQAMVDLAMTPQPNHIHIASMDLLSPLRIAQLRFDKGQPLRTAWGDLTMTDDDIDNVTEMLRVIQYHCDWDAPTLPPLNEAELFTLQACLDEAICTAIDDRMPRTARGMEKASRELGSGRRPMRVVLDRCFACWPDRG